MFITNDYCSFEYTALSAPVFPMPQFICLAYYVIFQPHSYTAEIDCLNEKTCV